MAPRTSQWAHMSTAYVHEPSVQRTFDILVSLYNVPKYMSDLEINLQKRIHMMMTIDIQHDGHVYHDLDDRSFNNGSYATKFNHPMMSLGILNYQQLPDKV